MIARWRCRLFGHRWQVTRGSWGGVFVAICDCVRCGCSGAVATDGRCRATYGAPDAVAACRTRAG